MALSNDGIRNILGILGNIISFFLFISPTPTFITIVKRKDVEQFSPRPYLATVLNCAMWVFYGLPIVHPHSLLVITINGCGLLIEFVYVCIYLAYSNTKQRMYVLKVLVVELVFLAVVVVVTLTVFHTHEKRSLVVGILCVVFNICMYAMPLDVMKMVIRTKSVQYMPFYLLLANFLNGLIWLCYAQLRFDLYITISNGTGVLLGTIQLILYGCYCGSTLKRNGKQAPEVQLSNNNDGRVGPVDV